MKRIISLFLLLIAVAICIAAIRKMDHQEESKFVALMETKTEFTQDEVDALWHFKNEHKCSEKFQKLYDQKIKDL